MFAPSVEKWRDTFAGPAMSAGLPIDFVLAWIAHESGGNVCSVGIAGVEAGLFQTYHPDDDRFGPSTFASLRSACAGTKQFRSLDSDEVAMHIRNGIEYLENRRNRTRVALDAIDADWPEGSSDFWKLVKLHHVLPALFAFLPGYKRAHGVAPSGWSQFRSWVEGLSREDFAAVSPNAARWSSASERARLFNNAENVGKYGGAEKLLGFVSLDLAVLLGVAFVLYLFTR